MMRNARLCCVLLAALLLLPLGGCQQTEPEEPMNMGILPEDGLTGAEETPAPAAALPDSFALPYDPGAALDPVTCPDGIQQTVGALLYEGLFELDGTLAAQNKLCTAHTYDAATLTWTFQLRGGVTFSDGAPLTASDVAATLNRARTSARYQARLVDIASVTARDGAVVVQLSAANTGLPALLDIPIVKSGTEANAVPIGTGPYVYSADGPCLTARQDWWGGGSQPLSQIALVACSGDDAVRYQFTSHGIQLLTTDLTGAAPLSATGSFDFTDADTTILQYVGFNYANSLFADAAVRRALNLGVDRETLVSAYLSGHALAAQFPLSPASSLYPGYLESDYAYSAFEAAMTEAGLNTGTGRAITLLVNSENSFKVSAARFLADSLSAFDLDVTVNALPWEDYLAALAAGEYDLYYGEARLTADWDLPPLLGTGGSLNYGGYTDPSLDQLLQVYASAPNRTAAMATVCDRLTQQQPILPVCFKRTSVLTQANVVEGLSPTAADPFHGLSGWTVHLSEG